MVEAAVKRAQRSYDVVLISVHTIRKLDRLGFAFKP